MVLFEYYNIWLLNTDSYTVFHSNCVWITFPYWASRDIHRKRSGGGEFVTLVSLGGRGLKMIEKCVTWLWNDPYSIEKETITEEVVCVVTHPPPHTPLMMRGARLKDLVGLIADRLLSLWGGRRLYLKSGYVSYGNKLKFYFGFAVVLLGIL